MSSMWFGVRDRVLALKSRVTVFGSMGHDFELSECLSEFQISEAEAQLGIRFPDEYRSFLGEVGAGGAGPDYGIFTLSKEEGTWRWEGDGAGMSKDLDRHWPHSRAWNLVGHPIWEQEPKEETFESEASHEEAWHEWNEGFQEIYWNEKHTEGGFVLTHEGCALRKYLVVTGSERGNIWQDHSADHRGIFPFTSTTRTRIWRVCRG